MNSDGVTRCGTKTAGGCANALETIRTVKKEMRNEHRWFMMEQQLVYDSNVPKYALRFTNCQAISQIFSVAMIDGGTGTPKNLGK